LVEDEAVPVTEYEFNGNKIIETLSKDHPWVNQTPTSDSGEWLSKVKWIKTFPKEEAKWITNGFANQNVVCKLRDKRTFDFLKNEFGTTQDID
jgi:hypothetical protein